MYCMFTDRKSYFAPVDLYRGIRVHEMCLNTTDFITDTYIFWNLLCQNFVLFLLYLNKSTRTSTIVIICIHLIEVYVHYTLHNFVENYQQIIVLCDIYIAFRFLLPINTFTVESSSIHKQIQSKVKSTKAP
jgi:hypothetical protein